MNGSLLVIDWDYFFPNPLEAGCTSDEHYWLYDWGHQESNLFIEGVWPLRADSFIKRGIDLPRVNDEWRTFARRFNVRDDAPLYVADSNAWSGTLLDSNDDPFSDVWLYDAHHDSGYNVDTFGRWLSAHQTGEGISFSCEDWCLIHHMQGSMLHWRAPAWHAAARREFEVGEMHWPTDVPLDVAIDGGEPSTEEFDTVFVCRSGAWVPPWEDSKFQEFLDSWDRDVEQLDDTGLLRTWPQEAIA